MVKEFEGATEKEAIDNAIASLGIDREEFDVEIVEASKKGIFKKGSVKIRVYTNTQEGLNQLEPETEQEKLILTYLDELLVKMGYPGEVKIAFRKSKKFGVEIYSDFSGILIGKKGKNLDAIQVLVNVYNSKLGYEGRIIVDSEGYRSRREQNLIRLALKSAEQVRRGRGSKLLEPMNPFERRLIHTTLNDMDDIDTKSEGDGLFKQVRVLLKNRK
jgi:spoIIIJ-associated protein